MRLSTLVLVGAQLAVVTRLQATPAYTVIPLGWLSATPRPGPPVAFGGPNSIGSGLNNSGAVAGGAFTGTTDHAFVGIGGALQDLGTLGGTFSSAASVNSLGQITGQADTASGAPRAFYWNGTSMVDIGTLGGTRSNGAGINDTGQITGTSRLTGDATSHAFLWDGAVMQDLGTLGGPSSEGNAINNLGQVTGAAALGFTASHAFLWNGTGMIDLGTLPGDVHSAGLAVNSTGQVTGQSSGTGLRAFFWDGTAIRDINPAGATGSIGRGINNAGLVVGEAYGGDVYPFLWDGAQSYNLNSILVNGAGWQLIRASDINELGQITGYGSYNGQLQAFLATPTPEPATWVLGLTAIAALSLRRSCSRTR